VFATPGGARAAVAALDGSRVLGEVLTLSLSDPLAEKGVPSTKRQRLGGGVE
jgi:hypothetical protein